MRQTSHEQDRGVRLPVQGGNARRAGAATRRGSLAQVPSGELLAALRLRRAFPAPPADIPEHRAGLCVPAAQGAGLLRLGRICAEALPHHRRRNQGVRHPTAAVNSLEGRSPENRPLPGGKSQKA